MNDNERDTHFQGFAKLLWDDLVDKRGYIDIDSDFDDGIDPINYRHIIAQRAYDLVEHTVAALWPYINDTAVDPSAVDIPDLDTWPDIK